MGRINRLDQITVNSIAAGEVVERPASVVKELCENSLDAGASMITIEIWQGGIRSLQVTDNGGGMDREDALEAFEAHATSKLRSITDLEDISSMGFRGEALPSIASVSRITLETRLTGETAGTKVRIEGGILQEHVPCGTAEGTRILVEDLFFNTPARYKFLKKDSTEAAKITETVSRLILARPDVSFLLRSNGKTVLHSPGNSDLEAAVYTVFGREAQQNSIKLSQMDAASVVRVSGLVGKPSFARRSRAGQYVFVNGRFIQSPLIMRALDEAYSGLLMKGEYAFAVLSVDLPPNLLDVNVHPQKLEVRFWNESQIFSAVMHTVRDTLFNALGPRTETSEVTDQVNINNNEPADLHEEADSPHTGQPGPAVSPPTLYEQTSLPQGLTLLETETQQDSSSVENSAGRQEYQGRGDSADDSYPAASPAATNTGTLPDTAAEPVTAVRNPELRPLLSARIAGTLFSTYILLEEGDSYYLIDQHAAHEKILFEQLMNRPSGPALSQPLLAGEAMRVTAAEMALLEQEKPFFEELGFFYDRIGERAVVLRAVPMSALASQGAESLRGALDEMLESGGNMGLRPDRAEVYLAMATRACKAAIKAHDRISHEEIRVLVTDLLELENPYQCPHGRPVIIRSDRRELEKRFRRIV